jgi:hypothetical protein
MAESNVVDIAGRDELADVADVPLGAAGVL